MGEISLSDGFEDENSCETDCITSQAECSLEESSPDGINEPSPAEKPKRYLPNMNFRPLLFCALGLAFGIFLYMKIRFGGIAASDFIFIGVIVYFGIRPLQIKRILAFTLCILVSAGAGVAAVHIYTEQFTSGFEAGKYEITGTVQSVSPNIAGSRLILSHLSFDGEGAGGKMTVTVSSDEIRTGDIITFTANIKRSELPVDGNTYAEYLFENGVRYSASFASPEITGRTYNPFLLLNSCVYDRLYSNMARDEASVAYALLTGNSSGIDDTLLQNVRESGIAHVFAVSGLHIGILYGAVSLMFFPLLKRKSFLPALAAAVFYCAFCGFTVSSLRAVIMCGVLSYNRLTGRKTDFLNAVSFAAVAVLLFMPAQWLSAGFRLSFGACFGLALFARSFARAFRKLPSFLGNYLAASLSVQIFTFPVLLECFGYFSVWGTLLNFFFIPILPVLFLGLLLCTLFSLVIPPAAAVFLFLPEGMLSLFLYVFSVVDFSLVLTGFSLGTGVIVWFSACVVLSQRIRLKTLARAFAAGFFGILFVVCVTLENAVFIGCKIVVYENGSSEAALVRAKESAVLIIDGDISLANCQTFLSHTYGGRLDAVVVLCKDEMDGINTGAFLPCGVIYARNEIVTGLRETNLVFGTAFSVGEIWFRYESAEKLTVLAEDIVVEIDFENNPALGADLFVGMGSGGLKFFLNDGIIKAL